MAEKKKKTQKRIQVEKDFLDKVLKSNADTKKVSEDLIKAFDKVNQELVKIQDLTQGSPKGLPPLMPVVSGEKPDDDMAFLCNSIACVNPLKMSTPEEITIMKMQEQKFGVEIKNLMLKYKRVQVIASLFKKI